MTQRHISHPEPLPACAAGHSARHIHDLRGLSAGGGHFVECRCRHTRKHAEPEAAIAEWKRSNRPTRNVRKVATERHTNVFQMPLRLAGSTTGNAA